MTTSDKKQTPSDLGMTFVGAQLDDDCQNLQVIIAIPYYLPRQEVKIRISREQYLEIFKQILRSLMKLGIKRTRSFFG